MIRKTSINQEVIQYAKEDTYANGFCGCILPIKCGQHAGTDRDALWYSDRCNNG